MAGQLTIDTLRAGSGVLATQNGMTGIAKAWLDYNGTTGTLNNSFNISSVTKNSAGYYTVNFTTAMPNANYAMAGMANGYSSAASSGIVINITGNSSYTGAALLKTTTQVSISSGNATFNTDSGDICVAFFSS